uniref:Sugar phosphate transporter domain-containing protein n=1 Tax=Alexandrium andersonii TaxID=327968 RepID=A0A7S2FI24_9DINO
MTGTSRTDYLSTALWCVFYASGIIGMLVVYGVLQERIMTIPYGGESFSFSVFLVFCNRVAAVLFAIVMATMKKEQFGNSAPLWKYLVVSLSNVFASTCQYESLKYVSFAVQMLGKSFKMMPVMLWGMAISGKRYSLTDWLIAAGVTAGVTEFLMTGPTASPNDQGNSAKGLLLLLAFLGLDGLTSTMQEKLFKEHQTSKYNQMLYINLLSCCVSSITLITSGTFGGAMSFCFHHGRFVFDASLLSASAVGGQFFIYSQVKEFGALVFAATMNVRQVVSIIVSYATYKHSITGLQILGLMLCFLSLFYKSYLGLLNSSTPAEKAPLLKDPEANTNTQQEVSNNSADTEKGSK